MTNKSSARAVAYLRVSTDKQENGLDAQIFAIKAWSQLNGIEVVGVFKDEGVSGGTDPSLRPGLIDALAAIRDTKSDFLVVKSRDRLARDVFASSWIEKKLEGYGSRVITATEDPTTPSTPEQELANGVVDVFSQYERAVIRRRTKEGLARVKARGIKLGAPGYEATEEGREKIQAVLDCHRHGMSLGEISSWLTANGVLTLKGGNVWAKMVVSRMIAKYSTDERFAARAGKPLTDRVSHGIKLV